MNTQVLLTHSYRLIVKLLALAAAPMFAADPPQRTLKTESFDRDPGWDNSSNRMEAADPPTVKQDFGWSPGRIGGAVWKSVTPAWYGMKLEPPLSFNDRFAASGKIAVMPDSGRGDVAYLGFFNHTRQGWRAWSSMAMRIGRRTEGASFFIDYVSGKWGTGAAEMECTIPADGTEHAWRFSYEPEATRPEWTDLRLRSYLTTGRQTIEQIVVKAQQAEPGLTRAALELRLRAALENGLVSYLRRGGSELWLLKQDKNVLRGAVTMEVAGNPVFRTFLTEEVRKDPVALDRFGIFNQQMFHGVAKFYVRDLEVNGTKIDLSRDPGWAGQGNKAEYIERDFQRLNFGYSPDSARAGGKQGEIGGDFFGAPLHGYYADDVGRLTLDDPIRFSGRISFVEGSTDAGMFFGFFNSADKKALLAETLGDKPRRQAWPQTNTLGVGLDSGHYRITAWCTPARKELSKRVEGPVFLPERDQRTFDFVYDPQANGGVGRITVRLSGEPPFTADLTPEQRKAGATFDRFGLMSSKGAKYLTVYLDDLTYTAQPTKGERVRHQQEIVTMPYPASGR